MIYVGKEYHLTDNDSNIISYNDGYFSRWHTHDGINVNIGKDICNSCMDRTLDVLNNEIDNLISEKHILSTIRKLKRSKENKNE